MARCLLRRSSKPNDASVLEIPDGESFDMGMLLWENERVRIWTVDGITITIERATDAAIDYNRNLITGLFMTVEFMGVRQIVHHGWCQRYVTAWGDIDPARDGLRWRFGRIERHAELEAGAVCARTVHGM